jgi:hypothetical protein
VTRARRLILAGFTALSLLSSVAVSFAQVPAPVPALPDSERRTSYSITASQCNCAVNFQLFGDSNDFSNWLEVFLNGVRLNFNDPVFGWTITSPTGPIGDIARPITNAVLTFNIAQTGTIQIVGARRPRRVSQFSENAGVSARNLNQALTDIVAQNRETWDKTNDVTGRAVLARPGETLALLPVLASRANMGACFDSGGNLTSCVSASSGSFIAGSGIAFTGTNPTTINNNIVAGPGISITGTNPTTISATSSSQCTSANGAGFIGNGVTPNDAAFNAWFSALPSAGGCIEFGAGKFAFSSQIAKTLFAGQSTITIKGLGSHLTTLYWPNAAGGIVFTWADPRNGVHFSGLSITTGVANGGTAVTLTNTAGIAYTISMSNNNFYDVIFQGDDFALGVGSAFWNFGTSIVSVANVTWDTCIFNGLYEVPGSPATNESGITTSGTNAAFATILNVLNSQFNNLGVGFQYGNFVQGVIISNTNFNGEQGSFGIFLPATSTEAAGLTVLGSQFNVGGIQIDLAAPIGDFIVQGSILTGYTTNQSIINTVGGTGFQIVGNVFNATGPAASPISATGIATAGNSGVITGNSFIGLSAGVNLLSGSANMVLNSNSYTNVTTKFNNSGTGNIIGTATP